MKRMTITLPDQQEEFLQKYVDDGKYRTRQEVILDAIRKFLRCDVNVSNEN